MGQFKIICVVLYIIVCHFRVHGADKYTDENRPYEFGFTIDGEQHRHEKKDENGIIMGEFGFITADGVYHVTVYATDENGNFKILSMKNIRVKPYPTAPNQSLKQSQALALPSSHQTSSRQVNSVNNAAQEVKQVKNSDPAKSCSHCSVPTTTTEAPKGSGRKLEENQYNTQKYLNGNTFNYEQNSQQRQNYQTQQGQNYQSQNLNNNRVQQQFTSNIQKQYNPAAISQPNSQSIFSKQPSREIDTPHISSYPKNSGVDQYYQQDSGSKENYPLVPGAEQSYPQVSDIGQTYPQVSNIGQTYEQSPAIGQTKLQNYPQYNANYPQGQAEQKYSQGPFSLGSNTGQAYSQTNEQQGVTAGQTPTKVGKISEASNSGKNYPNTYNEEQNLSYANNGKYGQGNDAPQNSIIGNRQPKSFNEILQSVDPEKHFNTPDIKSLGSPQPSTGKLPTKPVLVAAQMQIVNKNTDIYHKNPGEKDGLPEGLTNDDMKHLLYTFNYTVGFHGHHEEGYTNGAKYGYYYVTGRNGIRTRVDYIADETGFHPKISQEVLDVLSDDVPKPETEKDEKYGLKGYEFKWLYYPVASS